MNPDAAAKSGDVASQPDEAAAQPNDVAAPSVEGMPQASEGLAQPNQVTAQPGVLAAQPGVIAAQLGVIAAQPGVIAAQPAEVAAQPAVIAAQPAGAAAQPGGVAAQPGGVAAQPGGVAAQPVAGWPALRRAAEGLGVTAALIALSTLVWHDMLELAGVFLILGAMQWLHQSTDRHDTAAVATAAAVALAIWIGATFSLRHAPDNVWRDIAFATLGALISSQAYAVVTRRP